MNRTFPNQTGPSPRFSEGMAYDSKRGVTVMFGGKIFMDDFDYSGETWEYDGSNWTLVATNGPSPRRNPGMAFDEKRGVVVIFGGENSDGELSDTWEWDGHAWKEVATNGPSARLSSAMAYDQNRAVTMLVGGISFGDEFKGLIHSDVWTWDGIKWRNIIPRGDHPAAAYSMAYDSDRDRMIVLGPSQKQATNILTIDGYYTWEWDGQSWTKLDAAGPVRSNYQLVYDAKRQRTVFFGSDHSYSESDTWEWDGGHWYIVSEDGPVEMSEQLPGRSHQGMVYDEKRGRTVLFGGTSAHGNSHYFFEDTWEYTGSDGVEVFDLPQKTRAVIHGETTVYSVKTDRAIGTVRYQWRKNDVDLHDDGRITGATTNALTLRDVSTADAGRYSVIVEDDCHRIDTDNSDSTTLSVVDPHITSVNSNCPGWGNISVRWENATPNGVAALLYSSTLGSTIIPDGYGCAGVTIDLGGAGLRVARQEISRNNGEGQAEATVPAKACGNYLQLIDLDTCLTSNVVQIQ